MAKRRRRLGVTLLLILLVGAAAWLLGWSSFLTVKQIEVVGVAVDSPLKTEAIIALSGVRIGEPMARVSSASVKRELDQLPRIGKVSLIRKWPHRVVLVIKERAPALAILKGTAFELIDSAGNQYATVPVVPVGVPTLTIGGDYKASLKTAMTVIDFLPDNIRNQVTRIESSGVDDLQLTLQRGVQVIWGSSEELSVKSRVLTTLLAGPGAKNVHVFDVSAPYAPTTN